MRYASDIPGGFHASRVVLVDDDKKFHENSVGYATTKNVSYVFQLSPKNSLKIINAHQEPINMGKEIYNHNRHARVSTVVMDQFMKYKGDTMTGTELSDKIQHRSVRRVLTSGQLSLEQGIEMVNQGKAQAFVHKDQGNPYQRLAHLVDQLVTEFFRQETGTLQEIAERAGSSLNHPAFVELFLSLRHKLNLSEHYVVHPDGNMMLLSRNKEIHGLCVRTRSQLQQLARQAEAKGAPSYVVNDLEHCRCLLCPPDPAKQQLTEDLPWERCLYPVNHYFVGQRGCEPVYCTHFAGMFDVRLGEILSLFQYQNIEPSCWE